MEHPLRVPYFVLFLLAFALAELIIPRLIRLSKKLGAIDRPWGHKIQEKPVPFLGGTGIAASLIIALIVTLQPQENAARDTMLPVAGLAVSSFLVLLVGLVDDFRPVNAVLKLLFLFLASTMVIATGIHTTIMPGPWGIVPNILISLLWISGITSAFNSIDNTDGAAGGSAFLIAAGVFVISLLQPEAKGNPYLPAFACVLAGSSLGFLRHNWPRAGIYLGDNGSFFLGFTLGSLLLFTQWSPHSIRSACIPCILMTVPLLDLILSTFLRIQKGIVGSIKEAIVYCGHDHLSHRFQALGLSRAHSSIALWGLGLVSTGNSILLSIIHSPQMFWGVVAGHAVLVGAISILLASADVYEKKQAGTAFAAVKKETAPVESAHAPSAAPTAAATAAAPIPVKESLRQHSSAV